MPTETVPQYGRRDVRVRLHRTLLKSRTYCRLAGQGTDADGNPFFSLSFRGAKFQLQPYNNACDRRMIANPGDFDGPEFSFLERIATPGMVFVDIGANIGVYSALCGTIQPTARIVAVEPNPLLARRLETNLALNGLTAELAPVALGNENLEAITLRIPRENFGRGAVIAGSSGGSTGPEAPEIELKPSEIVVRTRQQTLLSLCQERGIGQINMLKIDIEGGEESVLAPFLADAPPSLLPRAMIVENNADAWSDTFLATLEAAGFQTTEDTGRNLLLERTTMTGPTA